MKPQLAMFVGRLGHIVAGILLILLFAGALLLLGNADPLAAFGVMLKGALGTKAGFGETLIRFAPLALVALGLIPCVSDFLT